MARNRTGEALLSLLAGGLQGYVQGRQAKMQRDQQQAEQDRIRQRFEQRDAMQMEERNRQIAGQNEFTRLLNAITGMDPNTPAAEFMKIRSRALDAGMRAGYDANQIGKQLDNAILQVRGGNPLYKSPLDALEEERLQSMIDENMAQADAATALAEERRRPDQPSTRGGGGFNTDNAQFRLAQSEYLKLIEIDPKQRTPEENQRIIDLQMYLADPQNKKYPSRGVENNGSPAPRKIIKGF